MQEFDPVAMRDDMDLDAKLKASNAHEQSMEKIRALPEREHLKKFQKYERLELYTKMVHEQAKIEGMI